MTASGALTEEQISLPSRNFSPSRALVRIAAEVPAASVLVNTSGESAVAGTKRAVRRKNNQRRRTTRRDGCGLRAARHAQWGAVLVVAAVSSMARWLGASHVCSGGCVGKHLYVYLCAAALETPAFLLCWVRVVQNVRACDRLALLCPPHTFCAENIAVELYMT
jgi:hypothetical protein